MRRFAVLALLTALVTTRDAWSAELIHELYGDTYAFTLEPDLNDPEIDTFDFDLVVESSALVRPVGDANGITEKGVGGTGFSRLITGPPPFIGPGLSIVGTTATNERLFQAYAKINGPFVDPSSWFSFSGYGAGFIAQAEIEPGTSGTATLRYFRAGEVVGIASTSFGVPEPAAVGLASLAAAGALGVRGRRSSFVAQERPIAYTDSRKLR